MLTAEKGKSCLKGHYRERSSMSKKIEQRKYSRSPVSLSVQVRLESGVLVEGKTSNISLNGLFLETERSLPLGSPVKIHMTLGNAEEKTDVICPGLVSRLDERGVAIEIGKIDDQSLHRLCGLVRATAVDNVLLEKELEQRLGASRAGGQDK
jgi:hypothetical protein